MHPIVRTLAAFAIAGGLAVAPSAHAADEATVAAVQLPAWVERGGRIVPLRPGFALQPGDTLVTGARGRVHLDTADGSIVKLGSSGRMALPQLAVRDDAQGGVFDAALDVVKGAFRFTTRLAGRANRRDVRVRVGVVTAGVRGTDIWGKSADDKDLICLLEGRIAVASDGAPEQTMSEPLTFYVVPKGAPPNPIGPVDVNKVVNEWAPQTEMASDAPQLSADGGFGVVVIAQTSESGAQFLVEKLEEAGYPAEVEAARTRYRVIIRGLTSQADAAALAAQLEGVAGVRGAATIRL
jgi:hypothetical protein